MIVSKIKAMKTSSTAYLGLGSNLGQREENLLYALARLASLNGVDLISYSSIYETVPWKVIDQPNYYNQCVKIATTLLPEELLDCILRLESRLGRVRTQKWEARVIDIDLLLYEAVECRTKALTLPHYAIVERAFVLVPLLEIAPKHTINSVPIREHLKRISQEGIQCVMDREEVKLRLDHVRNIGSTP